MPRGVTDQFLKILRHERQASVRTILAMTGLVVLAYFMAELTDGPLLGWVVLTALLSLLAGLAAGLLYAHHRTQKYSESLRESWNAWMRMSLSCERVDEVARHVHAKGQHAQVAGVGWAALFLANALLFAALWLEAPWGLAYGVMVTVANGLTLGALLGHAAWSLRWSAQFNKALDELIADGKVGLWGEV